LPIFYTTGSNRPVAGEFGLGRWADKMERQSEQIKNLELGNTIVEFVPHVMIESAPRSVRHDANNVPKNALGFSFSITTSVSRGASHWISLFDMHMKYADIVSLAEVLGYIEDLDDDLFVEQMPILAASR
jgi:hypothetical protein